MATVMAKVAVTSRVICDGKTIFSGGKLYTESATVQAVVNAALEKAAERAERSVLQDLVEACPTEAAMERRGTELEKDELSEMSVADLRDHFGQFLKVHAQFDNAAATPTRAVRN